MTENNLQDTLLKTGDRLTESLTLSFKDVHYSVQVKNQQGTGDKFTTKNILKGVSGICRPGELTALMGPSGGGKTTLLNLLACRIVADGKKSSLTGDIHAQGNPYDAETFSKFAGYLMQDDILYETQTPREAITFAATLRMHATAAERKKRVDQLLEDFQLNRAADTYIGGVFLKGISGGERKRTSLALELVNNPSVLLLDEPTSGLDSFTAFVLINLLKNLARDGKTIIFTIHQPSSDIFSLFDQLLLISDGKFIFQGDAFEGIKHFESIGYPFPEYANPADHYIHITHTHDRSNMYNAFDQQLLPAIEQEIENVTVTPFNFDKRSKGTFYTAAHIASRAVTLFIRHPVLLKARLLMVFVIAFLMISLYRPLSRNPLDEDAVFDINGALYFYCLSNFLVSLMGTALTFPVERPVFLREQNSKVYSVGAYFLGRQAVDIPLSVLTPALLAGIIYHPLGFNTDNYRFAYFVLISVLMSLSAGGFGLLVGSFLTNPITAATSVSALTVPFNIVSGYYINVKDIPIFLSWLQYVSPVRYSMEAFMWNEYDGSVFTKAPVEALSYEWGLNTALLGLVGLTILFRIASFFALKAVARTVQ